VLIALLILVGLNTLLLLLLFAGYPATGEEESTEIDAIGFRFTPTVEYEDEDGC
jgi:hypothetical protein